MSNTTEVQQPSLGPTCCQSLTEEKVGINFTIQEPGNLLLCQNSADKEVQHVLQGLLQKASPEELKVMQRILCSDAQSAERRVAFSTLMEEIQRTSRQIKE